MAWVVNGSYPYQDTWGELIPVFDTEHPPNGFWNIDTSIDKGYPYFETTPEPLSIPTEPLPVGFFNVINGDYPAFSYLQPIPMGAFCHATNLKGITIPESITDIGDGAFQHSSVSKVKISVDCRYTSSSFPEDCIIEFYD